MFIEIINILLISMSPVVELRGSIPFAILSYNFPVWLALLVSVVGNVIPPLFLIPIISRAGALLSDRSNLWQRMFAHALQKTRDNHEKKFEILKEFTLVVLVAIPLPFTGVWTASLASYVFGIPFRKAILLISLGVILAGIIVTLVTIGLVSIF